MPVKILRSVGVCLGLVASVACGPEPAASWMLGVWSGERPDSSVGSCGVPRLEIQEDGVLITGGGSDGTCLSYAQPEETFEYTWEQHGPDEIEAHRVTYAGSTLMITRGEDCNQILVR